ncbi:MAG: hypothetical protein MUF34_35520 [Polyangiaceae bacterium]|nr:hypothetical protein [Polyangiaceae bacterium]
MIEWGAPAKVGVEQAENPAARALVGENRGDVVAGGLAVDVDARVEAGVAGGNLAV